MKKTFDIEKFLSNKDTPDTFINILKSNGRSKHPEDINILEIFLNKYNKKPNVYKLESNECSYFNFDLLKEKIRNYYPNSEMIISDTSYDIDKKNKFNKQELWYLRDGLILQLMGGQLDDYYLINYDLNDVRTINSDNTFLSIDDFPEIEDVSKIFKECQLTKIETISIGMVSVDEGGLYIKDFDIKQNSIELSLLNEHYGEGFVDFNDNLINRLNSESKGLTLLHGVSGSGKTTYVRHLLKKLKNINKNNNILYFPPTMVETITDPSFINFISEWVSEGVGKNYLLIEDAEPLLESRNMSRNIGITNLLNLTDGLLNDILSVQIIATFNTKLSNLDDALLRPERLMARKEFTELPIDKSKELAKHINIDLSLINKPMTLAEIYSLKNERKPIMHNMENFNTHKIGFGSDKNTKN